MKMVELLPLEVEIFISSSNDDYPISVYMEDELDNLSHIEAEEFSFQSTLLDTIKPSTYNFELFNITKPFTKDQLHFTGNEITVQVCEFGYITTLLNNGQVIVQCTHKNLTICSKKESE